MKLQNDVIQALENYDDRLLDDALEYKELQNREKAFVIQKERRTIKKLARILKLCAQPEMVVMQ